MELTFYTCALVALASALRCVTHTNPVHSLLYLVVLLLAVAGIFLIMLRSPVTLMVLKFPGPELVM